MVFLLNIFQENQRKTQNQKLIIWQIAWFVASSICSWQARGKLMANGRRSPLEPQTMAIGRTSNLHLFQWTIVLSSSFFKRREALKWYGCTCTYFLLTSVKFDDGEGLEPTLRLTQERHGRGYGGTRGGVDALKLGYQSSDKLILVYQKFRGYVRKHEDCTRMGKLTKMFILNWTLTSKKSWNQ